MKYLLYLSLPDLSGESTTPPMLGDKSTWRTQFPFLPYASKTWLKHLLFLADTLRNPYEGYRTELGFSSEILNALAVFLHSRNGWTFLESMILFSSPQETLGYLKRLDYPIKETGSYHKLWRGLQCLGNSNALAFQEWTKASVGLLENIKFASANIDGETQQTFALRVIRRCRSEGPIEIMKTTLVRERVSRFNTMELKESRDLYFKGDTLQPKHHDSRRIRSRDPNKRVIIG